MSALFLSGSFTIASCPFAAAHDSGRPTVLLFRIRLTSSRSTSSFATASCPFPAAHNSAVRPRLSLEFTSRSASFSKRCCPTASCPRSAAPQQRCLTVLILRVGFDVGPLDQQLHHRLVPSLCRPPQR